MWNLNMDQGGLNECLIKGLVCLVYLLPLQTHRSVAFRRSSRSLAWEASYQQYPASGESNSGPQWNPILSHTYSKDHE